MPGVFQLVMMSIFYIHKQGIMDGDISTPEGLVELLSSGPERIAVFCKERSLSSETRERLVLWSEWSLSEEMAHVVRFLRETCVDRNEKGGDKTGFAGSENRS